MTQDSLVNEVAPRFKLAMYPELGDEMRMVSKTKDHVRPQRKTLSLSSSAKH